MTRASNPAPTIVLDHCWLFFMAPETGDQTVAAQLIRSNQIMGTIQDAIEQQNQKVAELKTLIAAEHVEVLAAIEGTTAALTAKIAELQGVIAAGMVITPEQLAALAAPLDDLAVAIPKIFEPPVEVPAEPAE